MVTSANVSKYVIFKDGKEVGTHYQHAYCKTNWEKLYQFSPIEDHTVQEIYEDENEVSHLTDLISLDEFLFRQSNTGFIKLENNNEFYYWKNYINNKESQKFSWRDEAVMAYHFKLLQWDK